MTSSSTADTTVKLTGYRWVILAVYALINLLVQIQWLNFASIARDAMAFYNINIWDFWKIDLFAGIFMIVFIIMCIPASYIIDTYGIRIGIGIGAVLTGIFAFMKGIFAPSYTIVLISQIGIAVAQPFILNSVTKVAVHWFPIDERATAVGIGTLSQFLGMIIVLIVTPHLVEVDIFGMKDLTSMLMIYGVITVIGAVILLALFREYPAGEPPDSSAHERFKVMEGFKHIIKQRDMILMIILFFLGLGMFNAIAAKIDHICSIKGFDSEQSGMIGGIILIAGTVGALILPVLSDKLRKRKAFLILGMLFMTPGLVGLTFFNSYPLVFLSAAVLGFFMLGAGAPVGFQYTAEMSYPAPESTSQGIILLAGQISGTLFIFGMDAIGVSPFMIAFIVMAVIIIFITTRLNESKMIQVS